MVIDFELFYFCIHQYRLLHDVSHLTYQYIILFTRVRILLFPAGKGDAERLNAQPGAGSLPVMTSGNGNNAPTVTGSTPHNGESKPPQAIVKPQILTHVIEGFVIQEGAEPFPVSSRIMKKLSTHWAHGCSETHTICKVGFQLNHKDTVSPVHEKECTSL